MLICNEARVTGGSDDAHYQCHDCYYTMMVLVSKWILKSARKKYGGYQEKSGFFIYAKESEKIKK